MKSHQELLREVLGEDYEEEEDKEEDIAAVSVAASAAEPPPSQQRATFMPMSTSCADSEADMLYTKEMRKER